MPVPRPNLNKNTVGLSEPAPILKIMQIFLLVSKQVWIGVGEIYSALFLKNVPFLTNIGLCPNFLDAYLRTPIGVP